ncbi:hypothetical protein C7N43_21960 [Sphingobacteriales bacterium UPWRP_1]|nr:hypothetical protein B6N25_07100 [Sphingobacteriales bacterium TSM_CSS]PSJ74843.1 hypothetical protein C7N43_21960 [Sphingobacteriales bacterium UPWRP_1]
MVIFVALPKIGVKKIGTEGEKQAAQQTPLHILLMKHHCCRRLPWRMPPVVQIFRRFSGRLDFWLLFYQAHVSHLENLRLIISNLHIMYIFY